MKTPITILLVLIFNLSLYSQQIVTLEENTPYAYNGIEYGYYISNATAKEVKGEDLDRYEISAYVINKSGCVKTIPLRNNGSSSSSTSKDDVMVAEFNCINATGKRLTAKKSSVAAKPWFVLVRVPDETTKEKYRSINAQAGYAIQNGQTITSRFIVIVPKGEKPSLNCRIIYLPDVQ